MASESLSALAHLWPGQLKERYFESSAQKVWCSTVEALSVSAALAESLTLWSENSRTVASLCAGWGVLEDALAPFRSCEWAAATVDERCASACGLAAANRHT